MARRTDIVVITRGRLEYLERTIQHIMTRTQAPYALHVVDDASPGRSGNVEYLLRLWHKNTISSLLLRHECGGLRASINAGFWMSFTDPVIITDDDVLCPEVRPDWLDRGLRIMKKRQDLGLLALNSPEGNRLRKEGARKAYKVDGAITYCKVVPGRFTFIRRRVFDGWALPHKQGQEVQAGTYPRSQLCQRVGKLGLKVAYITHVYCQHIGYKCARPEKSVEENILRDVDPKTLKPRDKRWAW